MLLFRSRLVKSAFRDRKRMGSKKDSIPSILFLSFLVFLKSVLNITFWVQTWLICNETGMHICILMKNVPKFTSFVIVWLTVQIYHVCKLVLNSWDVCLRKRYELSNKPIILIVEVRHNKFVPFADRVRIYK